MKFNIDNYKGKYVMHCKTKEEAEDFCRYLDSIGHMWGSGDSYLSQNNWNTYRVSTCYSFNIDTYGSKQYFKREGYTILEMENFMSDTMSNKDRINKVFEILGVKPNECFEIKGCTLLYRIDDNLKLHYSEQRNEDVERNSSNGIIIDILRGKKIIIPTPTEKEQLAIDYARALGCKWIAKDKEDLFYAFTEKPHKMRTVWNIENGEFYVINIPISFIHWDDEEPYYIGD